MIFLVSSIYNDCTTRGRYEDTNHPSSADISDSRDICGICDNSNRDRSRSLDSCNMGT